MLIPILISVIVIITLGIIVMSVHNARHNHESKNNNKLQKKGKSAVLKDAEKKLAHDPHNIPALEMIGDIYYADQNWEKTWGVYRTLYELSAYHSDINQGKVSTRLGISAYNLGKFEDAYKALLVALKKSPETFEINFYLGKTFYQMVQFEKALICLKKAKLVQPDNNDVNEVIGLCFFKAKKYKESLPFFKRVLDEHPDNKEIMFDLAVAMAECNMNDKALKLFMHLRPDPKFGPESCLEAGKMHEKTKSYTEAVNDYEIALKLPGITDQLGIQVRYRLANVYLKLNEIPKGLTCLRQIQSLKPGYKDVDQLVLRYSELNQNKNLQTYLLSGTSEFVTLCRKFISMYHTDSNFVKVEDVTVASECVDIIVNIESSKWNAKEIFRFYRSQNTIGDIFVRDFHSKIRDTKCDNGVCITMGEFTESAHKFAEGRPVDLIEKDQLVSALKKISVI